MADFDVLIIGAGLSGIGIACHLTRECPGTSFAVLERRAAIGGTWDLFRYPGIRSDSDMYSFAYSFRPWQSTRIMADGPEIRRYVQDTAAEYGVTRHIRFGRKVIDASWSTAGGEWTVEAINESTGTTERLTATFLAGCTGYYDYDHPYRPTFAGEKDFTGTIVHPQHWPSDLECTGQRVVIIGSGATAVTLVPALAGTAAHVTMLQRTPSYVVPLPSVDPLTEPLRRAKLPAAVRFKIARARNIAVQRAFYQLTRRHPGFARQAVLGLMRNHTRGVGIEHFTPDYNPWDQRMCIAPNGDLFAALRRGAASVVTAGIDRFTATGIRLTSGEEIPADVIITATGLQVQLMGGGTLHVDGEPVDPRDHVVYKGAMLDGVPNHVLVVGYTNISWTLKVDLIGAWLGRLLRHMDRVGVDQVVAVAEAADRGEESILGSALQSGYITRADARLPRQGTRGPWVALNDYVRDAAALRRDRFSDKALRFTRTRAAARAPRRPARTG